MKSLFPLLLLGVAVAAPASAQHRGDHRDAFQARREGRILPVREIERRVVPQMRGADYMGFDFEADPGIYTLKFLRDGRMIWVYVDGRTGQVVGRTGR